MYKMMSGEHFIQICLKKLSSNNDLEQGQFRSPTCEIYVGIRDFFQIWKNRSSISN